METSTTIINQMSQFKTSIEIPLEELFDSLPKKGLTVHSVTMEKKGDKYFVNIVWETPKFYTGRSVPINFPLEALSRRKLPKGVKDMSKKEKVVEKEEEPKPEPVKPSPQNFIRTQEDFDKALSEAHLEFMGVEPIWKLVTPDHKFTEGYFYRKLEEPAPLTAPEVVA